MEISNAIKLISHPGLGVNHATQWADLGCGSGFFTHVLSSFLTTGSNIVAIDSNMAALKKVQVSGGVDLKTFSLDFVHDEWPFSKLDGIMMANALHYVPDKDPFMQKLKAHLAPGGLLLIVEYDMNTPNTWVPYPITFQALQTLCKKHAFGGIEKINQMPSAFGRAMMYAALVRM